MPGKVELGKVQSLADVSSLDNVNEGSGENQENQRIIENYSFADLSETKITTKYSSTTIKTATNKKKESTERSHSRKNQRKGHRQHDITKETRTTSSPSEQAESEFALISTLFDSERNTVNSENSIIEPSMVPVNMEMHGPDKSMNINEVVNNLLFFKN